MVAALALASCARPESRRAPQGADTLARDAAPIAADSLAHDTTTVPPPADSLAAGTMAYVAWPVVGAPRLAALVDSLGEARWTQVLKLNRVDAKHVRDRDTLVLPAAFGDSLALSPFPRELTAVRDSAKVLLVSRRVQAFAAYDSGRLAFWGPVSTGRRSKPTPAGLYHTNWRDEKRVSTVDDSWLLRWCVNIENREGVSLHEFELPGRPASHSCVRLLASDARRVYDWVDTWELSADGRVVARPGTPVVVFGEWAWGERAPWKRLVDDAGATTLRDDEITDALGTLARGDRPDFRSARPAPAPRATRAIPRTSSPPDSARPRE